MQDHRPVRPVRMRCYAGNGYFSELYDTSDRTVQRCVKLQELGYVAVTNVRDGAAMQQRISPCQMQGMRKPRKRGRQKMSVSDIQCRRATKMSHPPRQKMSPTPRQKCRLRTIQE